MSESGRTSVLFVCLGNICRSPLAEGVFGHLIRERRLEALYEADSAGTGAWHVGEPPDRRSAEVAQRRGVRLEGRARQVAASDFSRFDWIIAMDRENLAHLEALGRRQTGRARLALFRSFADDPGDGEVPDPYYGGPDGFDRVFDLVHDAAEGLLEHLERERRGAAGAESEAERPSRG